MRERETENEREKERKTETERDSKTKARVKGPESFFSFVMSSPITSDAFVLWHLKYNASTYNLGPVL